MTRRYSDTPRYDERGLLLTTRYGTVQPLYHKRQYNVRGQLWDVQLGTDAATTGAAAWNRGRLQNLYTPHSTATPAALTAAQTTGPTNNGNLQRQNILLPDGSYWQQNYTYDELNRLQTAAETRFTPDPNNPSTLTTTSTWGQGFSYDQWGNRLVNAAGNATWGLGATPTAYERETPRNRLLGPGDTGRSEATRLMRYDAAGNVIFDSTLPQTTSGGGTRTFDAENRLTGAATHSGGVTQWQYYAYDGDGRRISRTAGGVTTWQVYGFGGELLAEYAAYGATFVPQQEYGYQGGKMLITARNGNAQRLHKFIENLYLRTGQSFTANDVQIRVNALAQAGYSSEQDLLTEARTQARLLLSQYQTTNPTATAFVQALYLSVLQRYGTSGANGEVAWWASQAQSNPDGVREAFLSSGEFADRVHNLYGSDQTDTQRTDAFAEHLYQSILGRELDASAREWLRNSLDQASAKDLPTTISKAQEWAQTLFNSQEYLNRGRDPQGFVYDLYLTYLGHEPDLAGWQYWAGQVGEQWQNKQAVLAAFANAGPYGEKAGTLYREIFWLVSDHLGTPRLIAERTGSAAGIKRHDYLPFGEEIGVGVGGRAEWHGYQSVATHDTARQQFTGYERDAETGLDYAQARYFSSSLGRFVSVDPLAASMVRLRPQSFNRYTYCLNNPLALVDPTGLVWGVATYEEDGHTIDSYVWFEGKAGKFKGRQYKAVKFGKSGTLDVVDTEGRNLRLHRNNGTAEFLGAAPRISTTGQDRADAFLGGVHGFVPGSKLLTDGLGMDAPEDSPIYQNAENIGEGVQIGLGLLAGTGEAKILDEAGAVEQVATYELQFTNQLRKGNLKYWIKSVAENGVQTPVKYFEENGVKYIIDGNHRVGLSRKLGYGTVPAQRVNLPSGAFKDSYDVANSAAGVRMSQINNVLRYIKVPE